MKEEYYSIEEVSRLLKVPDVMVRFWINSGRLAAEMIAGRQQIFYKSISEFIASENSEEIEDDDDEEE